MRLHLDSHSHVLQSLSTFRAYVHIPLLILPSFLAQFLALAFPGFSLSHDSCSTDPGRVAHSS